MGCHCGWLSACAEVGCAPPPRERPEMQIPQPNERRRNLIGGEWRPPSTGEHEPCLNPADRREVIGLWPKSGAADAKAAVDAAAKAFPEWSRTPGPERGRILGRAHQILKAKIDLLAEALCREEGKTLTESRGEVMKGLNLLEFYSGEGFRTHGKTLPSETRQSLMLTLRQPVGPVTLITPWNFPFAIPVWKTAPALVAGCTVVATPRIVSKLTEALVSGARSLKVGDGRDPSVQMGPAVDESQLKTNLEAIAQARADGARLLCGGERLHGPEHDHGFFVAPTVFDDGKPGSRLAP